MSAVGAVSMCSVAAVADSTATSPTADTSAAVATHKNSFANAAVAKTGDESPKNSSLSASARPDEARKATGALLPTGPTAFPKVRTSARNAAHGSVSPLAAEVDTL